MLNLTIAEVSGIIAAGLMIVQYTLPAALVIILVSTIGTENTAATWSSVNRTISTTIWPLLLRADTIGARHRSLAAVVLSWTMTFAAALLMLASIITPLGLRDQLLPARAQPVLFQYAKDTSAWGRVTPPRPDANFARYCEFGRRINCPGQFQGVDFVEVEPGRLRSVQRDQSSTINTTIPANFTDMFSSATSAPGSTLSGMFDIQYRRWDMRYVDIVNHGEARVEGDFRAVESLVIEPAIHLKEGLVVDTRDASPGLGFRNHTVPVNSGHGAAWSEDLTWLEPVTRCIDTNLTVELRTSDTTDDFIDKRSLFVVDRGAFVDLDQGVLETRIWQDNQTLDLHGRAYKAARMYNVLVARYLNLTLPLRDTMPPRNMSDPKLRRADPDMDFDETTFSYLSFDRVGLSELRGLHRAFRGEGVNVSVPETFRSRGENGERLLFASNFTAIADICRGHYRLDTVDFRASNISNPAVECGLVLGAGLSPGSATPFDDSAMQANTERVRRKDIFVCATGVRASVKTVHFRYNGTGGASLAGLEVAAIQDKAYADERSKPLWAVETSAPFRMTFDPLWGMVGDRYETAEGIHTLRAASLWLPQTVTQGVLFGARSGMDSLAAVSAPGINVAVTYGASSTDASVATGEYSYPTVERYGRLSQNATAIARIPSLLLTDALASLLVGTKSAIRSTPVAYPARLRIDDPPVGVAAAPVAVYRRAVRYDLRYAVPALLTLGLLAAVLCWVGAILAVARLDVLRRLRDMYNQTSTGRLATALLLPGRGNPNQSTSRWVEGDGQLRLAFGRIGTTDSGYFLKVDRDGEGGRPFLAPEAYGHGQEGYETQTAVKGHG